MTNSKKTKLDESLNTQKRNKRVSFGVVQVLGDSVAAGTQQIHDQVSFTTSSNTYPPQFKAPKDKVSNTTDIDNDPQKNTSKPNPFLEKPLNVSVDGDDCKITETVDCEQLDNQMSLSSSLTRGLASTTIIEVVKRNTPKEKMNITAPVTETMDINNSNNQPKIQQLTNQENKIEGNIDKYEKALEALDLTKIESKGSRITQEQRNSLPIDYAKILRDYADEGVLQEEPNSVQTTQLSTSLDNTILSRDHTATKTNIHITNNIQSAPIKYSNITELVGYIMQQDYKNVKTAIEERLNTYKNSNFTTSEIIDKSIVGISRKEVEQTNLIVTNDIISLLQNNLLNIKDSISVLKQTISSKVNYSSMLKETMKAKEDPRIYEMKDILIESFVKFNQAENEIVEKEKLLETLYNKNTDNNKQSVEQKGAIFQQNINTESKQNNTLNRLETKEMERLSFWMGIKDINSIIDQVNENNEFDKSITLLNNLKLLITNIWKQSMELKLIVIFKEIVYGNSAITLIAEIEDLENNNIVYINEYVISENQIIEKNLGAKEFGDLDESKDALNKIKLLE